MAALPPSDIPSTVEVTDPRTLRGLAHPVRMALIGLLRREGPMTATQAGERIDESPASCSFHLRQLAKYGLVEEAGGGRARRRPWRATAHSTSWPSVSSDPDQMAAATQLSQVVAGRYHLATIEYLERCHAEPVEWQRAGGFGDTFLCLTAAELAHLGEELDALLAPYAARVREPGLRPQGARHVTFIRVAIPEGPAEGWSGQPR
ncbi:MAG: helix-turn-helix domain-containing protein [Candidatus Dormibacter sp.]